MKYNITQNEIIYKFMSDLNLYSMYSSVPAQHIEDFLCASVQTEFCGKVVEMAYHSHYHRTTIAHFLNNGCWDESRIDSRIKSTVEKIMLHKNQESNSPIFFSIDDTVCCKRKPSSQAKAPIESASFHHSHLLGKKAWGHQVMAATYNCDDIALNYDVHLYDKKQSKIDYMIELAKTLPTMPTKSYMLCDSWFTCPKIIDAFEARGYHCIGALKTNRIIYPCGIRININQFAQNCIEMNDVDLVTVNGKNYYVYRYEGALNDIPNAVVLISWPADAFKNPKAMKAFICTDASLDTLTILEYYIKRWRIEIFFKQQKSTLGFDKYQIRKEKGIKRFWLLLSLSHLLCVSGTGSFLPFSLGREKVRKSVQADSLRFIYNSAQKGVAFSVLFDMLIA